MIRKLRIAKRLSRCTVVEEDEEEDKEEEGAKDKEELPDHLFQTVADRLAKLDHLLEMGADITEYHEPGSDYYDFLDGSGERTRY